MVEETLANQKNPENPAEMTVNDNLEVLQKQLDSNVACEEKPEDAQAIQNEFS